MSNISQWLNSGEYRSDIDNVLTSIVKKSERSCSESETSSIFETELYFLMRSKLGVDISFRKETPVNGIVHTFGELVQRKSGKGRLDAIVNNLIIEYKHHSKLKNSTDILCAQQQVCDYLLAIYNDYKEKYSAILTDGIKIEYFSFTGDTIEHTCLRPINAEDIDRIIKAILNNNTKKFEPINIISDFAIKSHAQSLSKDVARTLFSKLTTTITEKTDMLFSEWKSLMHLSADDNGKSKDIEKRRQDLSIIFDQVINNPEEEYKALFALQTTYAIIVKLIACKVVDNLNFNSSTNEYHDLIGLDSNSMQKFFVRMEDGYSYKNMNIRNFLEGDFFSWYADASQWDYAFYKEMQNMIIAIDEYSAFSLDVKYAPIDIFKDLYMSIIPQSIRHSMGEYFTPEWLSDCVISQAESYITTTKWRAIDPCCGSGIFVISLIKKIVGQVSLYDMSQEDKSILLSEILDRVYGIDINPLSVLSARVSYYLAIHNLGTIKDVEIPIYLGDSAIIPASKIIDGIECYAYSIDNLKCGKFDVILPKRYVHRRDFGKTMSSLQAMVKTDNAEVLSNVIINNFTNEEKESKNLIQYVNSLSDSLIYLHKNNWDGIWVRIVSNFMLIARLSSFDMIVGNPPWVKWEHLPAAYTRKIKEFCDIRHIFCNDGGMFGGAQLNICALISNVTASNWLKGDGVLAFLMPDSIMSQNSYEEFRNFYIDYDRGKRLFLQSIDRWLPPMRPFKVGKKSVTQDFNTYFYSSKFVDYKRGVPVREIGKKNRISDDDINSCQTWENVLPYLNITNGMARCLSNDSTAFTYTSSKYDFGIIIGATSYKYRTGVESTPFEVFKLIGEGASSKYNHYRFRNDIRKTARYKVKDIPNNGWDFPVKYIYPMVGGPSISPFQFDCANGYHIIPYNEDKTKVPVSLKELYSNSPELAEYFANNKDLLDSQSEKSKTMHCGNEFYALSKIGPYTFAPYIVAARDNSKFCASVIYKTLTPWGEMKQSICVKHTIIISQDVNGNFISEDEAHYINGILNSKIVVAYIHSTFKTNGFSLNKSNLFIPKYDPNNPLCTGIADLSKIATKEPQKRETIIDLLSDIYIELCAKLNH